MPLSSVSSATEVPLRFWQAPMSLADSMGRATAPDAQAVAVYANEGRWVVDCPDCGGAQIASPVDRRFMCNECANIAADGLWRPVRWPSEVAQIEAALEKRPRRHQHWLAGETVADLEAETKKMGASL